jgi:hypothetical protein
MTARRLMSAGPTKTMTTEISRYRIKARNAGAFEEAYQTGEANLRNSKHCLGYRLIRFPYSKDIAKVAKRP